MDIDVFDGNPLNFRYFMTLFREVVESKIEDPCGRLARLIKYTTGEAKELIKHCIEQPANKGYENAVNLLYRRYGDQHTTLAAYKKEEKEWPQIKVGDAAGFRKFYNFLLTFQSIISGNKWNDLPDSICMLLSKLPGQLTDRWNREVYSIRAKHSREPELKDLINYVDKETALASDPLFSKEGVEQHLDKRDVKVDKRRRVRSYAIRSGK